MKETGIHMPGLQDPENLLLRCASECGHQIAVSRVLAGKEFGSSPTKRGGQHRKDGAFTSGKHVQ